MSECIDNGEAFEASEILRSDTTSYGVLKYLSEGSFGTVLQCMNLSTKEMVAVKIIRDSSSIQDIDAEVSMLEAIGSSGSTNFVKFYERFTFNGLICLVFEMLDASLFDYMEEQFDGLSLTEIRPIAKQLLEALDILEGLGVLHTDIKPDNIMFVDRNQSQTIKLIDFGLAGTLRDFNLGTDVQPIGYRAPEVTLGLPITKAIDVWGVGCVLAFLCFGGNPFPVSCEYQMIKHIVEFLGMPKEDLISAGLYAGHYFREEEADNETKWRLATAVEYEMSSLKPTEDAISASNALGCLDFLIQSEMHPTEVAENLDFIDLMKKLLHLDGAKRISAHDALQHPFFSMSHEELKGIAAAEYSAIWQKERKFDFHRADPSSWLPLEKLNGVYNDEDSAFWSCDGEPRHPDNEDTSVWSLQEELCHPDNEDTSVWSLQEELCHLDNEDTSVWSLQEELCHLDNDDTSVWSIQEELCHLDNEDTSVWSLQEELCHPDNEDTSVWSLQEELCHLDNDDTSVWLCDGEPRHPHNEDTASVQTSRQKFLKRISAVFHAITAPFRCCFTPSVDGL